MGRLFWKFFACIWLAQLAGIIATGSLFWLTERHADRAFDDVASGPAANIYVGAAAAILESAGASGLRTWSMREPHADVYAIDAAGKDLLGRPLTAALAAHARERHAADPRSPAVTEVVDGDGRHYLLFAAAASRASDLGPPPPGSEPPGDEPHGDQAHGGLAHDGPAHTSLRGTPPHGPRTLPLGPALATLAASLITALLLAWYVAKPVRTLQTAFDAMADGNLALRVAPQLGTRHDELADLGRHFDRMAERLQGAMDGQRRLLHDVSHEVRSPLARLQTAVGLLRRKYSGEESTLDRIEEEIVKIDRLIGDLLNLSRIEAGELPGEAEEVDLHELVAEIVTDANFEAELAGRSVVWHDAAPATLRGRPEMLRVAIENVVRNALKHAPDSREIELETSLDPHRGRYTLRVLDGGPGLPEEALQSIFTPFVRVGLARSDGYGLGLAIARRSIEAHGGRISAENRIGGGLTMTIELPATTSPATTAADSA